MKSRGADLDKAYQQALDYTYGLKDFELPKFILISDFAQFVVYDLEEKSATHFPLIDLTNIFHTSITHKPYHP